MKRIPFPHERLAYQFRKPPEPSSPTRTAIDMSRKLVCALVLIATFFAALDIVPRLFAQ